MAKVNFNNLDEAEMNVGGSNGGPGSDVGFFTLKNDNDEAVVRFMCDSTDDFEILTVHDIQVGQRYRKVNCIRDPREPLDNCPLCKNGTRISNRFFIKMIQYVKQADAQGNVTIVPKAMMWERSTAYAKTLKSYLDNYGPLSDVICKIIRHGKAGDMQTTYEIVPNLSKAVFPDNIYVKDTNLFGDFNAFGTIVMDKSFEEMSHFLATGDFPQKPQANNNAQPAPQAAPQPQVAPQQTYAQPQYNPAPVQMPGMDNGYVGPQNPTYEAPIAPQPQAAPQMAPQYNPAPMGGNFAGSASSGGFSRPTRY